jgi:hypothetical protein
LITTVVEASPPMAWQAGRREVSICALSPLIVVGFPTTGGRPEAIPPIPLALDQVTTSPPAASCPAVGSATQKPVAATQRGWICCGPRATSGLWEGGPVKLPTPTGGGVAGGGDTAVQLPG